MIKIASYNVENLFARPKALNPLDWDHGKDILKAYEDANALIQKKTYSAADKTKLRNLLLKLDIYRKNSSGAIRRKYSPSPKRIRRIISMLNLVQSKIILQFSEVLSI